MAVKLTDGEGNEVEAYTKEEYEATKKIADESEVYKKQVDELNEKLAKVDEKSLNFKELRDKKELLEKELGEFKTSFNESQNKVMAELQTIKFDKQIKEVVGEDPELVEKIKYHYSRIAPPKEGEKDDRLESSILLATGGKKTFSGMSSSGGTPPTTVKGSGLTEEQKELGRKLGLSPEEMGETK